MKRIALILLASVFAFATFGQSFQKKISWKDSTFSNVSAEWIDLDNDSLLDVVAVGQDLLSKVKIKPFRNIGATSFSPRPAISDNRSLNTFVFTDYNHDNRIDLLVSAKGTTNSSLLTYVNKGNLLVEKSLNEFPLSFNSITQFADLDQDGKEDLVLTGEAGLKIFKSIENSFELKFDSLQLNVKDLSIRDFNKDGRNDIVISGNNPSGKPFLLFLMNKRNFQFEFVTISKPVSGTITSGDFNHDGKFDLVVSGKNDQLLSQIKFYQKDSAAFIATDSIADYPNANLLLADFDSDGMADLSFSGTAVNGKRYNSIRNYNGTIISLDTTNLISQRWGDYDRDGDLDLLQLLDSVNYHVFQILENLTVIKNRGPNVPAQGFAVSTFNKTFISWGNSTDDHTPSSAITYDLFVAKANDLKEIVAPEFNLADAKRLTVSHGKQTNNTFAIVNNLSDGHYNYLIQPVDNAFNGATRGNCLGGSVLPCFDLKHEYIQACKGDTTTLTSPMSAFWFSNSLGLLEQSINYTFVAIANDTIVSLVPRGTDCSVNRIWVINVNGNSVSEKETKYVCENVSFKLGIPSGWKNIQWKVDQTQVQGNDTIELSLNQATTITAVATTDGTCTYKKEFQIKISKPEFVLNGEAFQIKQGESVGLEASGMKNYVWSPIDKLSNPTIANPIASPVRTTEYMVIGTDSVGCNASAKVVVQVEETAFIPTLFTPNGDSKNDDLKVYGITIPSNFRFVIFNREGSVVYETKDWSLAANQGWNGTHNGMQQPAGLYYWKVEGKMDGEQLKLNGKTNGSVLLVR